LRAYGERYRHWSVAYSGGKDSSATVTFVAWAIREGLVPTPESLTVLYADTRQELPPLQATAMRMMGQLRDEGHAAYVVLPEVDDRFFVYMLGYGVPPPSNRFRWCTVKLKVAPMMAALAGIGNEAGEKFLSITGVRIGESAARDQRIAVSCSKDSGECGQGWFQVSTDEAIADTLAPLLHWRLCHVFDWLYEVDRHGFRDVTGIAAVYGMDDVRTGCVGCPLASRDVALERLVKDRNWRYLAPLLDLKGFYRQMKHAQWRKRKAEPELRKDGKWSRNGQRKGPLTMAARAHWLGEILGVQERVNVAARRLERPLIDLINEEEERRIREMWALDMWPQKWAADDVNADVPLDRITTVGNDLIVQPLLVR
jgi:DNA sulfur modification protein DndC